MAKNKGVNIDELLKLQSQMKDFEKNIDDFKEECCKEVAARLLTKVIKNTPVGQYYYFTKGEKKKKSTKKETQKKETEKQANKKSNSKKITEGKKKKYKLGGTLRRGWTAQRDKLNVTKHGNTHKIELINDVEYASHVEFGHRTRDLKGWVKGKHTLTIAEKEIEQIAPKLIEKKLKQRFGDLSK